MQKVIVYSVFAAVLAGGAAGALTSALLRPSSAFAQDVQEVIKFAQDVKVVRQQRLARPRLKLQRDRLGRSVCTNITFWP